MNSFVVVLLASIAISLVSGQSGPDEDNSTTAATTVSATIASTTIASTTHPSTTGHPGIFSGLKLPSLTLPNLSASNIFSGMTCYGTSEVKPGVCRSITECATAGGYPDGACTGSQAICCLMPAKCGDTTTVNNTRFGSPDLPKASTSNQICTITVTKMLNVKHVRLEMDIFELNAPTAEGKCESDRFWVSTNPLLVKLPPICGVNTRQHLILPLDESTATFTVNVATSGEGQRKWLIKIVQLEDPLPQAPSTVLMPSNKGCRQYLTGGQGEVMSFNFDLEAKEGKGTIDGLKYAICFRKEVGFCGIRFEPIYFRLSSMSGNSTEGQVMSRKKRCSGRAGDGDCVPIPITQYIRLLYKDADLAAWARNSSAPYSANSTNSTNSTITPKMIMKREINETETPLAAPSSCRGQDSVTFPPSKEWSGAYTACGNVFNGNKPLTIDTAPFVLYVDSGNRHGLGFHLKYTYVIC